MGENIENNNDDIMLTVSPAINFGRTEEQTDKFFIALNAATSSFGLLSESCFGFTDSNKFEIISNSTSFLQLSSSNIINNRQYRY